MPEDAPDQADTPDPADAFDELGDRGGTNGFTGLLGLEFVAVDDGHSTTALDVREALLNPYGGVHGAVLYAMADTGMGAALLPGLEDGERMATIEIKISYLRPATDGTLTCETTVLNRGRSVAYLESEVENDGLPVARATGSFSIFER